MSDLDVGEIVEIDQTNTDILIESSHTNAENLHVSEKSFSSTVTQTMKQAVFGVENFYNDNAGIHFYTGLETIVKFFFVLQTLGPAAYCLNYAYHNVCSLNVPAQFFLTLMKPRSKF